MRGAAAVHVMANGRPRRRTSATVPERRAAILRAVDRRVALQQMTVAGVLWGTIGPAVAYVDDHAGLSAVQISVWRIAIAAAVLTAFWLLRGRRRARSAGPLGRPGRPLVLRCLAIGIVTTGYQLAYFAAVASAGVPVPTFIALGLGPVLVAFGETVLFRRRPDGRTLAVLVAAIGGLALLMVGKPAEVTASGVAFALASAVGAAIAVLAAGSVSRRVDATLLNTLAAVGGLAVLAPLAAVTGGPGTAHDAVSILLLVHLGVVVSVLAYGLYFAATRVLPSTHVVILTLLEPLTAAALAVLLLGQSLTPASVAGGALLLGAVVALRGVTPAESVSEGALVRVESR
jgi:DME family drug/metabolite transporter